MMVRSAGLVRRSFSNVEDISVNLDIRFKMSEVGIMPQGFNLLLSIRVCRPFHYIQPEAALKKAFDWSVRRCRSQSY